MSSNKGNEHVKLAKRLREAREDMKLSRKKVARLTGIGDSTICWIESARRKVDVLKLKKLAQVYQRPLSYFVGGEIESPELAKVGRLAQKVAALSDRDWEELVQFAEFLHRCRLSRISWLGRQTEGDPSS